MRNQLAEVLDLQPFWSAVNTAEMQRRGELIRREIPGWIRDNFRAVSSAQDRLQIEGQDGVGRKARVPWVRIFSPAASPRPTSGWYVVYLFGADGRSCYLALSHGSTQWDGRGLVVRTDDEMASLMSWARKALGELPDPRLSADVRLGAPKGSLADSYKGTVVTAIHYDRNDLPRDANALTDLQMMVDLLLRLYDADDRDPAVPGRRAPEVALVEDEVENIVSPQRAPRGGQGFRLSKREQVAVEQRAVQVAAEYLDRLDWKVDDVGATRSYDLHCQRADATLYVEVKGTTSAGDSVVLTRNEVEFHRKVYPDNALIVVTAIVLQRETDPPIATGGTIEVVSPWAINEEALEPLAYTYRRR